MAAPHRRGFPVLLYAGLLVASVGLLRPASWAPIERGLGTLQTLPLRLLGTEALAANSRLADGELAPQRVAELVVRHAAVRTREALAAGAYEDLAWRSRYDPVPATVVARLGPRDRPWGLELDVRADDPRAEFASFVTVDDRLVGFLEPGGRAGASTSSTGADAVRVRLLHADRPVAREDDGLWPGRVEPVRRVGAVAVPDPLASVGGQPGAGEPLRFLVEPAASIDPWPLRCTLLDDPYRAARGLVGDPPVVRTASFGLDPLGFVPSGLRLGRLRAWGYPLHGEVERGAERRLAEGDDGAEFLPIGLFVEPAVRAAELVRVLLWRERAGGAGTAPEAGALVGPSPFAGGSLESVRVLRIAVPQPLGERWLAWSTAFELAGGGKTPAIGAAVVDGLRLVGTVARSGPGYAVIAPFGEPGERWPLSLMSENGDDAEVLVAAVVGRTGRTVRARPVHGESRGMRLTAGGPRRGHAFTGVGGRHLPAGLWLGRFVIDGDGVVVIERADTPARGELAVFRRLEGGPSDPAEGR
jgi:hypothetical protein